MSTQIIAALASIGLLGAGVAGASEIRAFDAMPVVAAMAGAGQAASKCRVDVIRSGTPGTADVTRAVYDNGGCVCIVTTGPASSNGAAEEIVNALVRERTCDAAPVVAANNPGVGPAVSAAATSGGGSGVVLPVLVGAVGAVGLAVALSNNSKG